MSRRPAFPRPAEQLERKAAEVLGRHYARVGIRPSLPVPVEEIVEVDFGLKLLWESIPEGAGEKILGALAPAARTILLNEDHVDGLFDMYIGPYAFTLAHELGHWLLDAENPDQGTLFAATDPPKLLCRNLGDSGLPEDDAVRERNANRFAARLLLPADLLRAAAPDGLPNRALLREKAAEWGVSQTTLRIRLQELGLPLPPGTLP